MAKKDPELLRFGVMGWGEGCELGIGIYGEGSEPWGYFIGFWDRASHVPTDLGFGDDYLTGVNPLGQAIGSPFLGFL